MHNSALFPEKRPGCEEDLVSDQVELFQFSHRCGEQLIKIHSLQQEGCFFLKEIFFSLNPLQEIFILWANFLTVKTHNQAHVACQCHNLFIEVLFECGDSGEKMLKLLGIVGSPRKGGNTEVIMKEALKAGAQEGAETELIHLVDLSLKPCDGCRTCFETKNCAIKDDVEKILEKMAEADGIIVGSPVYFHTINAQTKTFIDRVGYLQYARGREVFRNKIGGAIAVAGRSGASNAVYQILAFLTSARMVTASPVVMALAFAKGDAIKDIRGIESARELGKSMVQIAKATASLRQAQPMRARNSCTRSLS